MNVLHLFSCLFSCSFSLQVIVWISQEHTSRHIVGISHSSGGISKLPKGPQEKTHPMSLHVAPTHSFPPLCLSPRNLGQEKSTLSQSNPGQPWPTTPIAGSGIAPFSQESKRPTT
ncbi:hypothetical protein BASA81_008920 [Batrachochytrium salamandrivorans]|nr:hypothetical protein BASA81_008920 [Batrachochytrium salamandrivorans]